MAIDEKSFEIARAGLSLLGALQEQKRNAQPNIPFGFSVSSPKFSMSAQPRVQETDMLKTTIEQLEGIQKQREKVAKEQEALDAVLGKSPLGQQLQQKGFIPELQLGQNTTSVFKPQGQGIEEALRLLQGLPSLQPQQPQGQQAQQSIIPPVQKTLEPSISVDDDGKVRLNIKPVETEESKAMREEVLEERKATRQVETKARTDSLERLNKIDNLVPLVEQLEQQLESVPVGVGSRGKMKGLSKIAAGNIGADPFTATSVAQMEGFTSQIARTLGEVGNLADKEQTRAQSLMPKADDAEDTRVMKSLATLTFAKKIFKREIEKSSLAEKPEMKKRLESLNEGIRKRVGNAVQTFQQLPPDKAKDFVKKLQQFLGPDIDEIGLPSFSSATELEKELDNLESGDVVLVKGRLVLVE